MRIQGIDHIEFYVGDLEKSSAWLCDAFGFRVAGRSAPGSGTAATRSVLLRQGQIQLVLTTTAAPDDDVAQFVARHGDGVAVIAFGVDNVTSAFAEITAVGAVPISGPRSAQAGTQCVTTAVVSGFGDVVHRLVERTGTGAEFAPGTVQMAPGAGLADQDRPLLDLLDHVAVCVPAGELDSTVSYYRDVFGLAQIYDERIEVGTQAMASKVVQDHAGRVTFTLIEPDLTRDPGQIDEFLSAHGGAGVQHLAFRTEDIAAAVTALSGRGVQFLVAPAGYYQALETRLGQLAIQIDVLRGLNVLADRDRWGQMFQIFCRSTHERHTFFIELIERKGALTFGSSNIRALYEALDDTRAGLTH
ncbi:MAG TPA: 4-hydroxyphenylpyruvate dioxygenase [Streptosporangiaceae bacterium]|nr:4-hydroxyphenylpyruvate dioxygenase [Streptosporangiaceae bacterium]